MTWSISDVRNIFFSGPYSFAADEALVQKIHFLLNHDYLTCTRITIGAKDEFLEISSDSSHVSKHDEASGGGSAHIALKLLAQKYLLGLGFEAQFEQPFCGYYPDVISTDQQTVVECGQTHNVDKMFAYFIDGKISDLIQVPYPTVDDSLVYGYRFIASKNLATFLKASFEDEKSKILQILNRKDS